MPELPEVETVRRGLRPALAGRRIAAVTLNRPDLRFPLPQNLKRRLTGARIREVGRRAKYLLLELEDGAALGVHLGMSGRFVLREPGDDGAARAISTRGDGTGWPLRAAHDHIILELQDGAEVVFNDPRRFGYMFLFDAARPEDCKHLAGLGPEPLGNRFDGPVLAAGLAGRRTPIKSALLDQKLVAGLGNIYVCEALFRARLSPKRLAADVSTAMAETLAAAIKTVLRDAIEAGGSSLRDYVQASGALGYFQHSFQVYGREGETCVSAGCGRAITRITQSGRSSFYCTRCQR